MNKNDLKAGYLVEVRNSEVGALGILMPLSENGPLVLCRLDEIAISDLNDYNYDLTATKNRRQFDIVKVYGYAYTSRYATSFDPSKRPLLWERQEPKTKKVFRMWKWAEVSRSVSINLYQGWPQICEGLTKEEIIKKGYSCNDEWLVEEPIETAKAVYSD